MRQLPRLVLIGATGRNSGKTELACSIIKKFSTQQKITGVKVTAVRNSDGTCPRGGRGCGVCSSLEGSYCITEEKNPPPEKDTARLLRAGADRVYWLRVKQDNLVEGLDTLLTLIGPNTMWVCESNSLRLVCEPGLFLMTSEARPHHEKLSASEVKASADRIVISSGDSFNFDLEEIGIFGGTWTLQKDASAVILAGGLSRRMGTDKALLPINGKPIIEYVRDSLTPHFKEILISTSRPGLYSFLGERVVQDRPIGSGPLAGITTALERCTYDTVFVTACDMPEIDIGLIRKLLRDARNRDGAVPVTRQDWYEPLFAVYNKNILEKAQNALAAGSYRPIDLIKDCDFSLLTLDSSPGLKNLNTHKDYEEFRQEYDGTFRQGP